MNEKINKLFGIIPEGSRKLVVTIFSVLAVALMHCLGDVTAEAAISALWKLVGLYMVGNGAEHVGKGISRLPGKGNGTAVVTGGESGRSTILVLVIIGAVVILALALFPMQAKADILPFIDRLDLQFGPGMAIHDLKPVETEMVMLGTAKFYERSKFQARIGGLVDPKYRALVIGIGRTVNDLITRNDDGENKPLLPAIGIWIAANLIDNNEGEEEIEFLFGINAVMLEY